MKDRDFKMRERWHKKEQERFERIEEKEIKELEREKQEWLKALQDDAIEDAVRSMPSHDKTYCVNASCPFKTCDRHHSHLKGLPKNTLVSVADFGGTCREYLRYVLEEVSNEK